MHYFLILLYVFLSVSGLILFKLGNQYGLSANLSMTCFSIKIPWISILGLAFYVLSYLLFMILIAKSNLTQLIPVTTGVVYITTLVASVAIFKENVSTSQVLGSLLIMIGILLMNKNTL